MIKDIRAQDTPKIKSTVIQLKTKLLEYRFLSSQGNFPNTSLFRENRRTIAQLLTVLKERNEKLTNKDWKLFFETQKQNQLNDGSIKADKAEKIVETENKTTETKIIEKTAKKPKTKNKI